MLPVLTQLEVTTALVTLDMKELVKIVQVSLTHYHFDGSLEIVYVKLCQISMNVKERSLCVTMMPIVWTLMVAMSVRVKRDIQAMEHLALVS